MVIQNMFVEDINRKINGVVKVDEDENKVLEQELNEYVITRELKRHFADFFNTYAEAFDEPTADTGVWISGFFGSGKSHFLKMLSYLLENKEVNGIRTVERFRKKFEDDPGTFMQVDRATKGETETILFNIDYEGSINKDKTAVLRVFAKVFYNHLGFFGSNLEVAMLEQYITQQGKMDEFCRLIEEKKGKPWTEVRKTSVYKGYKQDKIEMRGDRAEMSDFPLYLNMVAGGLDCRDQAIGGFSFVVKIYALPVVEIIGQLLYLLGRYGFNAQFGDCL